MDQPSSAFVFASKGGVLERVLRNEYLRVGLLSKTLLEELRDCGRRVPEDVSVVAIGPDDLVSRFGVSGVALPADIVGSTAVELVMAKLDGETVPAATMLRPILTVRETTAAAPLSRRLSKEKA